MIVFKSIKTGYENGKNAFFRNRQRTEFYLFVTTADKPFKSLNSSNAIGKLTHTSSAPVEHLDSVFGVKIWCRHCFGVFNG